jgi:uncharacterized protein YbcV (DUF1398 family)
MNISIMKKTTAESLAGTMPFPEVIGLLLAEGVESYHADLVKLEKTFYMPDGETFVEELSYEPPTIGNEFSADGVVAAIKAIQAKEIKYKEFLQQIMEAGTTAYFVFLDGKKAIYYGRKGDFHIENFPQAAN